MLRRSLLVLAALVLVSGLSGCGRLLGKRYDNFTAYYNTYYNAREEFEREEETLLRQDRPVDRSRFLDLFVGPTGQAGAANEGFTKAIEKGADLLREHPESKWIDDALLLIGKARFYQADWTGAEEKFREVIGLGESKLDDEAGLWLGRALTAAERYDDAALALREALDRENVRERWAGPMRLALAEVDVRRGDLEQATESLEAGLERVRDKELAARAAFLLGQVYEALDEPDNAAAAYARVLDYGPRYELIYAAQLSRALALGFGGEADASLALLRRMRRDDKNFQSLAEIDLARARVLAAADRPGEARNLLRDLLYDPDPAVQAGALRGQIHYRLAEVYRDGLRDYVRAAAHYDTSSTSLRRPPAGPIRYTREAISDAEDRSTSFGSYARVSASIAEMDSLLYLGGLDDESFAAAIEAIRAERRALAEAEARELERRRAEQGFGEVAVRDVDGPGDRRDRGDGDGPRDRGGDGVTGAIPGAGRGGDDTDLGFLSYRNASRAQEQLISFQARWGDRPLVPNWRRSAAIGGGLEVQQALNDEAEGVPGIATPDFTRDEFVDVADVPRDAFAQQQMMLDRAAARYELGNVLFLSLGEPEAAGPWYRLVIEEDGTSALAQRAYFALAETQRALGNEDEANDLYRQVVERYAESTLADQARERLGLAPREVVVEADSLADARAAYTLAYERWKSGDYAVALDRMLSVSEAYPSLPVAPQARLAAGALYTEWAAGDSAVLLAPIPVFTAAPGPQPTLRSPSAVPSPEENTTPTETSVSPSSVAYTWVVGSDVDSLALVPRAEAYVQQGLDAEVFASQVGGTRRYRLGLGRFVTQEEAERAVLPDDAPTDSWLFARPVSIPPAEAAGVPVAELPTAVASADTLETTAALTDSTGVAALDSLGIATLEYEEPWLYALYASIEEDYPGTPYAERARATRAVLDELYDLSPPQAPAADSVAAEPVVAGPEPAYGLEGDPLSADEEGVTWVVYSSGSDEEARAFFAEQIEAGYRAGLYVDRTRVRALYHVAVGLFATSKEAQRSKADLPGDAQRIVPLASVASMLEAPPVLADPAPVPREDDSQRNE